MELPAWAWPTFIGALVAFLGLDLFAFHRKAHVPSTREALVVTGLWAGVALAFAAVLAVAFGPSTGVAFTAGYLMEWALAVDNVFVFVALFSQFRVPPDRQDRVLFFAILGAIVLRGVFIAAGLALVHRFAWALPAFGVLLLWAAYKISREPARGDEVPEEESRFARWLERRLPFTRQYDGQKFVTRVAGKLKGTPLLLVLALLMAADLLFAIDSVPAVFAVTTEPFLVFTSNALAILGLRSMFFLLSRMVNRLRYLRTGLAVILGFVSLKLIFHSVVSFHPGVSILVVLSILLVAVVASLRAEPPATA
ncbi:MAG TPA: TerC/Alx family metal homeostasis membrane protein [Deinococcales bacterium]|nr:TerC/Alx family metal homeostasis membrane protein [Deinococcales bacterium]